MQRSKARAVRVLGGVPSWKIQRDDAVTLLRLLVLPSAGVTLIFFLIILSFKGVNALEIWSYLLAILLSSYLLIFTVAGLVAVLTWPSTTDFAIRRSPVFNFAKVAGGIRFVTTVLVLCAIPFSQFTLAKAQINLETAEISARLPEYYTLSFGGIVDDARDWDPMVKPFQQ